MADPYDTYNPYRTQTSLLESSLEALQQQKREAQERQLKSTEFSLPLEKSVAGGIASALTMGLGYALGGYKGAGIGAESSKNIVPTLYGLEESKAKNAAAQAGLEVEAADQAISTTREQLGRYQLEGLKAQTEAAAKSPGGYEYELQMQKLAAKNQQGATGGLGEAFNPESFKAYREGRGFPSSLSPSQVPSFIKAATEDPNAPSPWEILGVKPNNPALVAKNTTPTKRPVDHFAQVFKIADTTDALINQVKTKGLTALGPDGASQGQELARLVSAIKNLRGYGAALTETEAAKVFNEIGYSDFLGAADTEIARTLLGRRQDLPMLLEKFKNAILSDARTDATFLTYNFDDILARHQSSKQGKKELSLEERINKELADLQQLKAKRAQSQKEELSDPRRTR